MNVFKYISATLLGILFIAAGVFSPHTAAAQSAENDCTLPEFEITSSTNIYAIAGESFSYYVVTDSTESIELDSPLPSGLDFVGNQQITGTPSTAAVGDHEIQFRASNDCGEATESISLTVLSGDSGAAAGSEDDSDQTAASGESVALNEIPETGIVADTALTVMFYLLALLLIAGWFGRRVQYAMAGDGSGDDLSDLSVIPSLESRYTDMMAAMQRKRSGQKRRFGDGMKR